MQTCFVICTIQLFFLFFLCRWHAGIVRTAPDVEAYRENFSVDSSVRLESGAGALKARRHDV